MSRGETSIAKQIVEFIAGYVAARDTGKPHEMLIFFAKQGAINNVQKLVDEGVDPLLVGEGGENALDAAVRSGREAVVDYLKRLI